MTLHIPSPAPTAPYEQFDLRKAGAYRVFWGVGVAKFGLFSLFSGTMPHQMAV